MTGDDSSSKTRKTGFLEVPLSKTITTAGILSAFAFNLSAQTSPVTVTNFVTVTVTNVVTVTNFVAKPEVIAKTRPAPKKLVVPVRYPWESNVSAGLTVVRGNTDTTLVSADFLTQKKRHSMNTGSASAAPMGNKIPPTPPTTTRRLDNGTTFSRIGFTPTAGWKACAISSPTLIIV